MAQLARTSFRERIERLEDESLSPLATRSYPALRAEPEPDSDHRTPFQRDRDRIVHCKSFRRLKHKTQVFISPEGDHYRTRLTHTLEACGIARGVARALGLNEDLTEAIGLGHDLGHPPFGHTGEAVLDACLKARGGSGFRHNEHSLRVVDVIERLNLTAPVRDGILRHTGPEPPESLEGRIVRLVDRVAYINHDIDDAIRAGVLRFEDLPRAEIELLGSNGSERIETLVVDVLRHSRGQTPPHGGGGSPPAANVQGEEVGGAMGRRGGGPTGTAGTAPVGLPGRRPGGVHTPPVGGGGTPPADIVQGEEVGSAMLRLREFMFERVYLGPSAQAERPRIERMLRALFDHYMEEMGDEQKVVDWLAGMTDRYAIREFEQLSVPQGF